MKNLLTIAILITLASCGRVESPQEFFDITGTNGDDAQNCFSEQVQGGVNVVCGDSSHFVADGQNGTDGQDGQDGQDGSFSGQIEYKEVCRGNSSSSHIETLLFLDGKFMAFLASGNYQRERLVILDENVQYRTTDGRNKLFKIINADIVCN